MDGWMRMKLDESIRKSGEVIIQPNPVIEEREGEGVLLFLPVAIAGILMVLICHLLLAWCWCRGKRVEGGKSRAGVEDG